MEKQNTYSVREEIVNTATHGVGLLMGLAVCTVFLVESIALHTWMAPLSLALYLFGVCSSYLASVVYHAIPSVHEHAKAQARKFDHAAIYWHIAGSYTPLTLIGIRLGGEPRSHPSRRA